MDDYRAIPVKELLSRAASWPRNPDTAAPKELEAKGHTLYQLPLPAALGQQQ